MPAGAVDVDRAGGPRHEPDREPARPLRPARARRAASRPALGSPVQWLFDRTEASGAGEGQLVAVSLSHATDEIGASVAELRERYLPALERLLPAARGADGARLRGHARAARDVPRRAGHAARCGPARGRPSRGSTSPARGPTPAGRRRWRARCAAAVPPPGGAGRARGDQQPRDARLARRAAAMTVAAGRAVDAAQRGARARDRRTCSRCSTRRLVEGRARDQRDDRRRGSLPPPLPRPRREPHTTAAPPRWIRAKQRAGRVVGDLLRRARRPLDDGRGLRRAAARRRPARRGAHAAGRGASSATPAASSARASSRACGSRCSRSGRGTTVPTLPPEQILLPPRAPLSIYSFGCWARQTIVALSIVTALRPRDAVPFGIDELRTGDPTPRRRPTPGARVRRCSTAAAHRYERRPVAAAPPPRAAHGRALDRRAPGARRLVGRHPAAVGLVDRRPCTRSATRSTTR